MLRLPVDADAAGAGVVTGVADGELDEPPQPARTNRDSRTEARARLLLMATGSRPPGGSGGRSPPE